MARLAMVIDTKLCVGCQDCVAACKTENDVPLTFTRDWLTYETTGKFPDLNMEIRSERCNHCDDAPCVTCCPSGASQISEKLGGIVWVDHELCTGCKACMAACPYDARFIHPDGYASKCTFCMQRIVENQLPACVSVCPTHCMYFGDLENPNSEVSQLLKSRRYHTLNPEAGTKPQIYYLT